ncbi:MAG TPA: ribose-phosphate pyrophosphokinase [Tenuifilaceae bacterium]|jgi:ribose-phosphate pyrophosphokinase|nr:ribose-phosphate pyrophosphokinase [Bacteroidales bacterium]HNT41387.1 ribose-phosphate pyrophosphokinase [Tenuifilaceae bacterium]MBP8643550.1 ribose-phosphate pyrophosphokinase [Bacteroidales bacterium]NLI88714.1 ribose-phosphate pyrophosphokinase [Bacteroidales bacterium]HNY08554.1 ribose-phosphate pyrophosphokinase [Tenuifilaceae bacterium]
MHSKHNIKFFTGRSSRYLSERIADSFGIPLGKSNVTVFSDGEFQPSFDESVRGCTVFIIQSTFPPVDNLFELLLMVDAAHRASAYKVVAVMPYFGWARQDRKDKPRVAIGAKMVANMLRAAGVDRIMTMDLHADQIQGFFDVPVDHLYASSVFVPYLKSLQIDNIAIASPDMGGAKRANAYARFMNASLVLCYKNREKANQVDEMTIIGDVRGKNVVILDDMVDTAGTLTKASGLMKDQGALSVRAFATHPVMSGKSYELIRDSQIDQLVVTDTIPLRSDRDTSKIKVLSVAELFADVIEKVYNYKSISEKFII